MKARIYDTVRRAGRDGITGADLNKVVFGGRASGANLRMHVAQINGCLTATGMRIRGDAPLRGRYRLVKYGDCRGS